MVGLLSLIPSLLLLAPNGVSAFATAPTAFSSVKRSAVSSSPSTTPSGRSILPPTLSARSPTRIGAADNDNVSDDATNSGLQRRRSFLATFAVSAFFPTVASARFAFGPDTSGGMVLAGDDVMDQKEHGTTPAAVQEDLRYGVSRKIADRICSYNRMFAENGGYWENSSFEKEVRNAVATTGGPVTFYDSVTGKPLFKAPVNRSVDDFIAESRVHGWPSFRDAEVVWSDVRVLSSSGETVSAAGTHLGHNLPDKTGNRYCINLVCIAGNPRSEA